MEKNLEAAEVPIEVTVRPIEPQGKLIVCQLNIGGIVIDDFKVVNGKNGIFLGETSKPDPTTRTGYRSTARVTNRAGTAERGGGRRLQHGRGKADCPRRGPASKADPGADGKRGPPSENAPGPPRQRARRPGMTDKGTSGQSVQKSPELSEGLFLMDGIEGLRSLPRHSVDMLLTDPPYGTTRNFWDVPLPLPELWEAVKWAVKPDGAILFFAQCPYDKVLGASNLSMLRYEWVWYKKPMHRLSQRPPRSAEKKTENILVFYQKLPLQSAV